MRRIISTALFGDGDKYTRFLPAFVRAHLNIYPIADDWKLHIYVDPIVAASHTGQVLNRLAANGLATVVNMGPAVLTKAMLWRLAPVFQDAAFVFCRDIDAVPMPRDRACMESFMATGCVVHTIHDNVAHVGIMGGLCGFDAPAFRRDMGLSSLDEFYFYAQHAIWAHHGTDQTVLNRFIDRRGGPDVCEHRFNGWFSGPRMQAPRDKPGRYGGGGRSSPVPDKGWGSFPREADLLGAHLGCAGYDHEAAKQFWDVHGDPDITRKVSECEA